MLVSELAKLIDATFAVKGVPDKTVSSSYVCDLLSWVMAQGKADCAWVTVQTHMNVVAVAALHDMACIILPEGIEAETASAERAAAEGIAMLCSKKTAYEICGLLYQAGVPAI